MLWRDVVVWDAETDGQNPNLCSFVEIASVSINSRTLKIIPDSEFHINIKPAGCEKDDYLDKITGYKNSDTARSCIQWHSKQLGIDENKVLENWRSSVDEKTGVEMFLNHVNKFNWKSTFFTSPISGGQNNTGYDNVILNRMCNKYGFKYPFWKRDSVDLLNLSFYWLSHLKDCPKNFTLDTLREFFGIETEGAHTAEKDVKDCAELILKYLRLHKHLAPKINFKNACYKEQ